PGTEGTWYYRVDAWSDPIATWRDAVEKKMAAGQDAAELANDLAHGSNLYARAGLSLAGASSRTLLQAGVNLDDHTQDLEERVQLGLSAQVQELLGHHPSLELGTHG